MQESKSQQAEIGEMEGKACRVKRGEDGISP